MHCVPDHLSIGMLLVERNAINDSPEYQRQAGVWSAEKQQLFLDSIINRYDVPKLYLHDLRGKDPRFKYAIIDGKQRLHAVWSYLDSLFPLAEDFKIFEPEGRTPPPPGTSYKDLPAEWQEILKSRLLDVVLVQNADEDDIEELFSRLNNGEPLNAAEKRNAMGGDMTRLIRQVAGEPFFKGRLPFKNTRYQHYEVAAKLLLIEKTAEAGGDPFCDLKKRFLDRMVEGGRHLSTAVAEGLQSRVHDGLTKMGRVFEKADPLLGKQTYPQLYYLFVKIMEKEYAHRALYRLLKTFLDGFHARRRENLQRPEDDRDAVLLEFDRLMQQGTNDLNSLRDRVAILRRYFLQEHPDVAVRDKKRAFTDDERLAIYILGGKRCAECGHTFADISEMEADHQTQWAHGGATTLNNGRALCKQCNQRVAKKVQ